MVSDQRSTILWVFNGDFSVSTSLSNCFKRFTVDGRAVYRDCIQFHVVRQPLIVGVVTRSDFKWHFVKSAFSLTGGIVLGELYLANVA